MNNNRRAPARGGRRNVAPGRGLGNVPPARGGRGGHHDDVPDAMIDDVINGVLNALPPWPVPVEVPDLINGVPPRHVPVIPTHQPIDWNLLDLRNAQQLTRFNFVNGFLTDLRNVGMYSNVQNHQTLAEHIIADHVNVFNANNH